MIKRVVLPSETYVRLEGLMFWNVFHGSQAPKAPQDCSANKLDVTEELLYEGSGFVISSGG